MLCYYPDLAGIMVSYSQNIVEASFISQTAPASTIWLDFFVTTWTQYWYLLFAASWVAWEIERMIITFYLHKPVSDILVRWSSSQSLRLIFI